jgi:WD40 repeat protein
MKLIILALLNFLLVAAPAAAQDKPAVISATNITHLKSVQHIDFADLPKEAGIIENGWFALTPNGSRYALVNRSSGIVLWDLQAGFVRVSVGTGLDKQVGTFIDGSFASSGELFTAIYSQSERSYLTYHRWQVPQVVSVFFAPHELPTRVWAEWGDGSGGMTWVELTSVDSPAAPFIKKFPVLIGFPGDEKVDTSSIPSGPESDPDAYLRIGRIDPPLAVTVSKDGLVKRWNLEAGKVTARAKVDGLPGAGQVNADGRYFAWRDGESNALHLLDFETGKDRLVSRNGNYIPFLALTSGADVIIGVNMSLKPTVTAWDVATGRQIDLGEYRQCDRQPDMVRLSGDGTTLVIGCNTGLDIWRVKSGE